LFVWLSPLNITAMAPTLSTGTERKSAPLSASKVSTSKRHVQLPSMEVLSKPPVNGDISRGNTHSKQISGNGSDHTGGSDLKEVIHDTLGKAKAHSVQQQKKKNRQLVDESLKYLKDRCARDIHTLQKTRNINLSKIRKSQDAAKCSLAEFNIRMEETQTQTERRIRAHKTTLKKFRQELASVDEHWQDHISTSRNSTELDKEIVTVRDTLRDKMLQVGDLLRELLPS